MNNNYLITFTIIIFTALCISLYFNFKPNNIDNVKITIPSSEGNKEIIKPKPLPQEVEEDIKYVTLPGTIDTIYIPNKVNLDLLKEIQELMSMKSQLDSLSFYKRFYTAYIKSIEINNYKETFEDEFISGEVLTTTTGTMDNQIINWKIKERNIDVQIPKRKSQLLIGGGIMYNTTIEKPSLIGELSILTPNSNIWSVGYTSN